jgi:hypothetical protein
VGAYKNLGAVSGLRANRTALGVADDRLVALEATGDEAEATTQGQRTGS